MDPYVLIEKLKQEIERLRAELALARGETSNEPLPEYEIERIKNLVNIFLDTGEKPVFGDYRKIDLAFNLLRVHNINLITGCGKEGNYKQRWGY
jgi:kinesin family protein 6/9